MDMKSVCLYVLVFNLQFVYGQFSTTPCPGVFDFEDDGQHIYAKITLRPVAPVSSLVLTTNFTIAAQLKNKKYKGRIDAVNSRSLLQRYNQGQTVRYLVHFPVTSPLPKLTALTVNGDIICYGPGDVGRPNVSYITTLSLQHTSFLQHDAGAAPVYNNFQRQPQTRPYQRPQELRQTTVNHIHIGEDDGTAHPEADHIHIGEDDGTAHPEVNHIHIGEDDGTANSPPQGPRQTEVNHIHIGEDDASAQIYTFDNIEPTLTTGNSPNQNYEYEEPAFQDTSRRPIPVRPMTPVTRPNANDNYPPDPDCYKNTPGETVECGTVSGGNNRIPLIYNGNAYDRGELPWLVAIYKSELASLRFVCGGTLVSDRHIVTAAQCIYRRSILTSIKDIVVKLGVHNLNDWSDEITVTRTVQSATVHEAYNPATLQNDILMLTLDKRVKFNQYIRPACLWSGNTDLSVVVGRKGVVAGWGDQGVGGIGSQGEPHKVDIPIVSTNDCRASKALFHELTYDNTLCAGDRQGSGPCAGDSGGGMYLLQDGKWSVRGVVSVSLRADNGHSDCNLNEYVVFTDTAQFLPWIKNILAQN